MEVPLYNSLFPEGLAVDWVNKMLYWTDARAKKIEVFDLEKGHRGSLITTGEDTLPRTIIVDPTTRLLVDFKSETAFVDSGMLITYSAKFLV